MCMSQDTQDMPKQSYKELYKVKEREEDRQRDGKTTSQSGQERC